MKQEAAIQPSRKSASVALGEAVSYRLTTEADALPEADAPPDTQPDNRLNSETEIYDTTMSMLNGCPL